ncbi:MAG: hypothetical protein FD170_144 [Bacteroidetes bacterium]|nr:MAG: hypothetical protein FD170_144 [Bacteroidota bacterium]
MKKVIVTLSVFAFLFAFSGISIDAKAGEVSFYSVNYTGDENPNLDGTKKAAKADGTKAGCGDKSAKASSGDCSKSCGDKSAKASSTEAEGKKATTATAAVAAPDVK